ncbi:MAG: hypothetical protein ACYTDU_20480, partial [Planctomycetota bacterium]
NGDGTFAPEVRYGTGDKPTAVVLADLDGDDDLDAASANQSGDNVSVLLTREACVCAADFNGDGLVSTSDLLTLLSAWGECMPGSCPTDLNGDGQTSTADLLELLSAWGPCP